MFSFFLSAFVSVLIAKKFGLWEEAFAGFFAAFFVVLASYASSPVFKLGVALASLLTGCCVSLYMLQGSVYPQWHVSSGLQTHFPLFCTYAGGIISLGLLVLHSYFGKKNSTR